MSAPDREFHPVIADRFDDLADLFESHASTRGCWCMSLVAERRQVQAGWNTGDNRRAFEQMGATADPPMGMIAYERGTPVGWCALGPRRRYPAAIGKRATIFKGRDPDEDDSVWLVPCFFVRVGHRRAGITRDLLNAVVELARARGVPAVEGWPLADDYPSQESFESREHVFAACGFRCIDRPTPRRAVMRLDL